MLKEEFVTAPGVFSVGDQKFVNFNNIPCRADGKSLDGMVLISTDTVDSNELRNENEVLKARLAVLEAEAAKKK